MQTTDKQTPESHSKHSAMYTESKIYHIHVADQAAEKTFETLHRKHEQIGSFSNLDNSLP